MKPSFISFALLITMAMAHAAPSEPKSKPNIIFILADDLGYGDVHCLNPVRGKIPTPQIDRFAAQGMVFTDAHSSSAVCTPSRYSILTGRYNWRSSLQHGVLGPYSPPLIPSTRLTVAKLLKQHGYTSACIGKWHLGWNWPKLGTQVDFSKPITAGPTAAGFDFYFGVDVPNYPPYCFIENDHTVGIPTTPLPKDLLGHNLASKAGLGLPGWNLEEILPAITNRACDFIQQQAKAEKPFFLYFPLTSPHTPLSPTKEWIGKSGLGTYADFVMETDAMIGKVLQALEDSGVASNTLVIFSSDNGCAPYIGVHELEAQGHFPSAKFRGYKSDVWDGGHRIPFIVRWPKVIQAGSTNPQLVCQMDFMGTCADILGVVLPKTDAEDSVSLLPLFKGEDAGVRTRLIHHSATGIFAIREGNWKLILCPGSGGWSAPQDAKAQKQGLPDVQLYDLGKDIGEQHNLAKERPEIVQKLTALIERDIAAGRSTPGAEVANDVTVDLWKTKTSK